MNLDVLQLAILAPAFAAGLLVLSTHVPLGQEVLRRGIIFIDLAVAQIAGLGVIAAAQSGWEPHGWGVQLAAVTSAMAGAGLLSWLEKRWGQQQEALIGVAFVLAATASILVLANDPHGGEHLKELMVGQILWVGWEQLIPTAFISALILLLWFGFRKNLGRLGFYLLFALAVTASVQLVGIYLVFASLIIPALGTTNSNNSLIKGYLIGMLGFAGGLMLSSFFDLPSGAIIVWTIAIIALLCKVLFNKESAHL